jgi:hypothetical protein
MGVGCSLVWGGQLNGIIDDFRVLDITNRPAVEIITSGEFPVDQYTTYKLQFNSGIIEAYKGICVQEATAGSYLRATQPGSERSMLLEYCTSSDSTWKQMDPFGPVAVPYPGIVSVRGAIVTRSRLHLKNWKSFDEVGTVCDFAST